MSLPAGVPGVTLTTDGPYMGPDGTPATGQLVIRARVPQAIIAELGVDMMGTKVVPITNGTFSVVLMATDAPGVNPQGWTYQVTLLIDGTEPVSFDILLPAAAPHVSLPAITPVTPQTGTYVVVTGPPGDATDALLAGNNLSDLADVPSARLHLGLGTAATTAATAYDASGAAAAALAAAETYADEGDVTTLAEAKAYTDTHSGGGGSTITTRSVRITDDNLSGLPSASSWTVVQTSAGTHLQCSIPAAVGDRIEVCGNFMRGGSHFLDWVILDSGGGIAQYASTGTSSPGTEGSPTLYPSLSFSYATAAEQFTVQSGQLSGGSVTIALAHQGTASGTVYAHTTYPWRLRLKNLGPEPA